jgi:hypothetical protein
MVCEKLSGLITAVNQITLWIASWQVQKGMHSSKQHKCSFSRACQHQACIVRQHLLLGSLCMLVATHPQPSFVCFMFLFLNLVNC